MPARARTRPRHARSTRSRRLALTALAATGLATSVTFTGGTASAASAADWQKLASCESGGNWQINTGNGYYGGVQFSYSTWLGYGGGAYASRADLATPEQQMAIADKVLASQGWNAWPSCSRKMGLYGTSTSPTSPPPPPPAAPPAPAVYGAIGAHYAELGGAGGRLGAPVTSEAAAAGGGRFNLFQYGSMYWTPATGAHEVHGLIGGLWRALGSESSVVGYPTTDENATVGRYGAYNYFQGGAIFWSPTSGAHEVHGAIFQLWDEQGREKGVMGFPTSDEQAVPGRVAALEHFEGGTVTWSPTTSAHTVRGAINDTWSALGGPGSALGLPTSGEFAVPGGRQSNFEHGVVTWTPTSGTSVRQH